MQAGVWNSDNLDLFIDWLKTREYGNMDIDDSMGQALPSSLTVLSVSRIYGLNIDAGL